MTYQRPAPYLIARCVHVWKTGRYAISDFPNLPDGYYRLQPTKILLSSIQLAERNLLNLI